MACVTEARSRVNTKDHSKECFTTDSFTTRLFDQNNVTFLLIDLTILHLFFFWGFVVKNEILFLLYLLLLFQCSRHLLLNDDPRRPRLLFIFLVALASDFIYAGTLLILKTFMPLLSHNFHAVRLNYRYLLYINPLLQGFPFVLYSTSIQ